MLTATDNTGAVTTQSFTIAVENSEIRVNTEQTNAQSNSAITTLINGNIVAWYLRVIVVPMTQRYLGIISESELRSELT